MNESMERCERRFGHSYVNKLVHCRQLERHVRLGQHVQLEPKRNAQLVCCDSRYGFDVKQRLECVQQQCLHGILAGQRSRIRRQLEPHDGRDHLEQQRQRQG